MDKQFVPYDVALLLQEKGFNETCFGFYWKDTHGLVYDNAIGNHHGTHISAPLYQQVIDWFRKTKDIQIEIRLWAGFDWFYMLHVNGELQTWYSPSHYGYNDAMLYAIKESLTLI